MPPPSPNPSANATPAIGWEWINAQPHRTPLVWLHGLGSSSTGGFASVVHNPVLGFVPSLLVDLPGHGRSEGPPTWSYGIEAMADAIASELQSLLVGPMVLMGHSLGGSVAIALATRHPAMVAHLIAAEPGLDPGRGVVSARIARQPESAFMSQGFDQLVRATARLAAQGSAEAGAWLPDLQRASPVALHRASVSLLAERQPTFREHLLTLPMAGSLITGATSSHLGEPTVAPHLQGYVVHGAGHQLTVNNPAGFAAILADIVRHIA